MWRLFLTLSCFLPLAPSLAEDRPNVLFISIDDLNDWAEPFGGHPEAITPHLDRFAEEGAVVFQNTHCPGPVCGPSRSALLSGFMPHRSGLYGNTHNMLDAPLVQQHSTLPEFFSRQGYHTLSRGKIAHAHDTQGGRDSGQWMYDEWIPTEGGTPVNPSTLTSRRDNLIEGKPGPPSEFTKAMGSPFAYGVTRGPKEETRDHQTAVWAAEALQRDFDKPFFLAVGLSKPHLPFYSPQEFWDLYPKDGDYAPEIREDDLEDILTPSGKPVAQPSLDYLWLKQNGLINEAARAYLACSSFADHCLGVIFDALKQSPHADNTIVVVWGDHGWHLGEKLRYRKAALWTEGTRCPMLIRRPGMTQRQDCARPVNLIDFYPTLVDLCGLPEQSHLDGRSLAPLLDDPQQDWPVTLTIKGPRNASVRDERWTYIRYISGAEELYDRKQDPLEWTNLAGHPDHAETQARLAKPFPKAFADSPSPKVGKQNTEDAFWKTVRKQRQAEGL